MKRYGNLLEKLADNMNIVRYENEVKTEYIARLVYSAICKVAYASLFDVTEDNHFVSINHFNNRIDNLIDAYLDMFPEISGFYFRNKQEFQKEIYEIFLKTGQIYHSPYRIVPAKPICATESGIVFLRGFVPDYPCYCSGAGAYTKSQTKFDSVSLEEMFWIERKKLTDYWNDILLSANFSERTQNENMEFLCMKFPSRSYWVAKPDKSKGISVARSKVNERYTYYLYQNKGGKTEYSEIPPWIEGSEMADKRLLTNSCLASKNILPSIRYNVCGDTVYMHFGYLPPESVVNFIKLYSWPGKFHSMGVFERIINRDIFDTIKIFLCEKGYNFEEDINVRS